MYLFWVIFAKFKAIKKEEFQLVQVETKSQNKAVSVGKSFYNVALRVWTISGFCSAE